MKRNHWWTVESFSGEGKPLLRKESLQDELGVQAKFLLEIKEQKTFLVSNKIN